MNVQAILLLLFTPLPYSNMKIVWQKQYDKETDHHSV